MKRQLILWILMTAGFSIAAQSLLTTSGAYHQNVQGSIDWSLGEVFINQFDNSQGIILQGFQQGNQLTVAINATDTSICPGENVILEANSLGGGPNHFYSWSTNPGGFLAPSKILSVQPSASAWYIVEVNDGGISPNIKDSIFIQVNTNNFNISFSASPTSFTSPPFNTTISNTTANSSHYKWNWSFGDGNMANTVSPTHTYDYDGAYTISVIATDSITGCYDTLVKPNYISCSGAGPDPCTLVAEISPSGGAVICLGDSIKLSATNNPNATYNWILNGIIIPNANDSILWAKSSGMYQVMLTDTICSIFSSFFNLAQYPVILPVITSNGSITPCTNDSMELISSTGFSNYIWNTMETTNSIWVKNSGHYTVSAEDVFGCRHSSIPFVVNASLLPIPEICIVGVDSATNNNRIIWQRQTNPLIDSFRVYRETTVTNQYQLIGSKAFNDQSLFIDANSNPAQQAYRYKITAVDTCGAETPLSDFHKTNHLTINAGMNNTWNLIWDGYQGFNFGSYRIYRGIDSTNMTFLTQIQSSLTSYTDLNPPTGNVFYQIEVISPHSCYPDSILGKANTNYNNSRSNRANTSAAPNIGFENQLNIDISLQLYPNPNDGNFTLEVTDKTNHELQLHIYNSIGEEVYNDIFISNGSTSKNLNLSQLSSGIYFLNLNSNDDIIYSTKVIINK